jgi:PAS domain S-box-containing protein
MVAGYAAGQPSSSLQFIPTAPPVEQFDQAWRLLSLKDTVGLAQRHIFFCDFESDGAVWIAASDGLYYYDGYNTQKYTTTHGLPSDFIRCVRIARDKKIWIGTDNGVAVYDGFSFHIVNPQHELAGPSVRRIVEDPDGTLWFCCDHWPDASVSAGLSSYHDGLWKTYRDSEGLPSNHVVDYFRDSRGRQFVLTLKGLAQKDGERWIQPLALVGFSDSEDFFWSITESPRWGVMATTGSAIYVFKNDRWSQFHSKFPRMYKLCTTADGEIISFKNFGEDGHRFLRWNGDDFEPISALSDIKEGEISCVREAPDGSIWCLGLDCLVRWTRKGGEWTEFQNHLTPKLIDNQNRIWFVSADTVVRKEGEKWEEMTNNDLHLALDAKGDVWGWSGMGVVRWQNDHVDFFDKNVTELENPLRFNCDANGNVWLFGHDEHGKKIVSIWDGLSWLSRSIAELEKGLVVGSTLDPHNGIWYVMVEPAENHIQLVHVSSPSAEARIIQPGVQTFSLPFFYMDKKRNGWLYSEFGLYRLTEQWERIKNLIGNNVFFCIEKDDNVWFACNGVSGGKSGLMCFHEQNRQQFSVDVRNFGAKATDGTIYFGGEGCLYVISERGKNQPVPLNLPARKLVTGLVKDFDDLLWIAAGESLYRYHPDKMPPETNVSLVSDSVYQNEELIMLFNGIERFKRTEFPRTLRFSWRIDQEPWSDFHVRIRHQHRVDHLPTGKHILQVKAQDQGFDIDPTPAEISFTILPIPIYERAWFKPVINFLFLSSILLAIHTWITKRKLARYAKNLEETVDVRTSALQESERLYRAAIEVADAVPYYQNYLTNSYEFVGAQIEAMTGYSADEFSVDVWLSMEKEILLRGDLISLTVEEAVKKARGEEGVSWQADYRIKTRYGEEKWLANAAIQVRNEQGVVVGSLGILQDITDRKRAEKEKEKLEDQLRQSMKMEAVGQLAGGVAHDFNNLLTGIIGNLSLLESMATEEIRKYILSARHAADRAAELVQQLLAFSRKSRIMPKAININHIVEEIYRLFRETIDRRIDIVIQTDPALPPIQADISQINSMIMNLCLNARDAINDIMNGASYPERRGEKFVITIQTKQAVVDRNYCKRYTYAQPGSYVVLLISDNGIGMDEVIQQHVFEPFFTTKDIGKGTGLGLASVYGIVKQHRGWINLESKPGVGTTFMIYFPIAENMTAPRSPEKAKKITGGKETLLLIDDEELILNLARSILEQHGYTVFVASDGNEGLSTFHRHKEQIDLIILDLSMPYLSGSEFLETLRTNDADIKVIISSGYSDSADFDSFQHLNVADFVTKPYKPADLIRVIRKVLDSA